MKPTDFKFVGFFVIWKFAWLACLSALKAVMSG